jgi:hypothetical protein
MRVEQEIPDLDYVLDHLLWADPPPDHDCPTGAAAAMAVVATVAFLVGLALAALFFI